LPVLLECTSCVSFPSHHTVLTQQAGKPTRLHSWVPPAHNSSSPSPHAAATCLPRHYHHVDRPLYHPFEPAVHLPPHASRHPPSSSPAAGVHGVCGRQRQVLLGTHGLHQDEQAGWRRALRGAGQPHVGRQGAPDGHHGQLHLGQAHRAGAPVCRLHWQPAVLVCRGCCACMGAPCWSRCHVGAGAMLEQVPCWSRCHVGAGAMLEQVPAAAVQPAPRVRQACADAATCAPGPPATCSYLCPRPSSPGSLQGNVHVPSGQAPHRSSCKRLHVQPHLCSNLGTKACMCNHTSARLPLRSGSATATGSQHFSLPLHTLPCLCS
jgi:hypothetical protein